MPTAAPRAKARWLALCLLLSATVRGQEAPLFVIPTESALTEPVPANVGLRVALYARDLSKLAGTLGLPAPESGAERLEYTIASYPQLASPAGRTWLESTFVIDFQEPDPLRLREELRDAVGERPSRQQLVDFVSRTLKKSRTRNWDVASTVARNREGDCTEHAVLTAALARSVQIPARVALGIALVSDESGHAAYGHAWTELLEDGRWVVADAALNDTNLNNTKATVRYIPFGLLADEGPGYTFQLMGLTNTWIQRIVVLGPVATPDLPERESGTAVP